MERTVNEVLDDFESMWAPKMRAVSLAAELQFEVQDVRSAACPWNLRVQRSDGEIRNQDHDWSNDRRTRSRSPAQRMEPVAATNLFLNRLLSMPNSQAAPSWEAAQSVQVSAFADGSNYRAQMDAAINILNVVKADCGGSRVGQPQPGPEGQYGLPAGYTLPAGEPRSRRCMTGLRPTRRDSPPVTWS